MKNENLIIERAVAYGIDWYITSILANFANAICYGIHTGTFKVVNLGEKMPIGLQLLSLLLGLSFIVLYFYLFGLINSNYRGQSIGKLLTHIKVVNIDGSNITIKTIINRVIVGFVLVEGTLYSSSFLVRAILANSLPAQAISILLIVSTIISVYSIFLLLTKGLMLHDYISKTKVVKQ